MTTSFSWDNYEDTPGGYSTSQVKNPVSEVEKSKSFNWDNYEDVPSSPDEKSLSFIPKTNSSEEPDRLRQAIQMPLAYATLGPRTALDAWKTLGVADALQELEDLEDRGIPIDREKYLKGLEEAIDIFPSLEKGEKWIEEKTGIPLEAKTEGQKTLRRMGEAVRLLGSPKDLIAQARSKNKISPTTPGKPGPSDLTKTGEKYALQPVALTEIEQPRGVTPVISRQKAKEVTRDVAKSAEKTVNAIIKEKIPAAEAQAKGLDLQETYNYYYKEARQRATTSKNLVDMQPVINWMDKEIAQESKRVLSLSPQAKKRLSILREQRKKLITKNPEFQGKTSKVLDEFGRPIHGPNVPEKISHKIRPEETIDQFHEYSDFTRRLLEKSERTGLEQAEAQTYQDIKNQLVEAMKKSGNEHVARPFGYANETFSQTSNLNLVDNILQDAFKSPKGLKNILKGSNRGHLEKALGKDIVQHFDEIAKYQATVYERMKEFVKIKDPKYLNIRKLYENIAELPGRIAGVGYTGKNPSNLYVKVQKAFLKNELETAERLSKELLEDLGIPTIEVKPKEISSS